MFFKFFLSILFFCGIVPSLFAISKYQVMVLDYGVTDVKSVSDLSINEKGQVCGLYNDDNGEGQKVFLWDPINGFKKLKIKDHITPIVNSGIKTFEHSYAQKVVLNNDGTLAVQYDVHIRDERSCAIGKNFPEFFILRNGNLKKLAIPNCINNYLRLFDICNDGQLIFFKTEDGITSLFTWNDGDFLNFGHHIISARFNSKKDCFLVDALDRQKNVFRFLDPKTGRYDDVFYFKGYASCEGLNNQGVAIGTLLTSDWDCYGYILDRETGLKLHKDFFPVCLNNSGQIVGTSTYGQQYYPIRFFILDGEEKIDLNKILNLAFDFSCPVGSISHVAGINDRGQMVGIGDGHAILLNPID